MQTENAPGEKGEMLFNTLRTVLWIKLFFPAPYFTPEKSTFNAEVDIFTTSLFIVCHGPNTVLWTDSYIMLSPLTYSDWNITEVMTTEYCRTVIRYILQCILPAFISSLFKAERAKEQLWQRNPVTSTTKVNISHVILFLRCLQSKKQKWTSPYPILYKVSDQEPIKSVVKYHFEFISLNISKWKPHWHLFIPSTNCNWNGRLFRFKQTLVEAFVQLSVYLNF